MFMERYNVYFLDLKNNYHNKSWLAEGAISITQNERPHMLIVATTSIILGCLKDFDSADTVEDTDETKP